MSKRRGPKVIRRSTKRNKKIPRGKINKENIPAATTYIDPIEYRDEYECAYKEYFYK